MALNVVRRNVLSLLHANEPWKGFHITLSVFTCPQAKHNKCSVILVANSKKRLTAFVQSFKSDSLVHIGLLLQKCLKNLVYADTFYPLETLCKAKIFLLSLCLYYCCISWAWEFYHKFKITSTSSLSSSYCFSKLVKQQQRFTLWSKSLKAYQSSFLLSSVFILLKTTAIQIHKLSDLRPGLYN